MCPRPKDPAYSKDRTMRERLLCIWASQVSPVEEALTLLYFSPVTWTSSETETEKCKKSAAFLSATIAMLMIFAFEHVLLNVLKLHTIDYDLILFKISPYGSLNCNLFQFNFNEM